MSDKKAEMRAGMMMGVEARNSKLRAAGSDKRVFLDERGKMRMKTLTAEELAEERELYENDLEDEEEEDEGEG